MVVWLPSVFNCCSSLYDPNHKTGNSIWCTCRLQKNNIRKTSIPLASEPFWWASCGMCPPIYITQCIISAFPLLEILMHLFFQCIISTPHVLQILMDMFVISTPLVLQILMDLFPNALSLYLLSYKSWWTYFDHVLGIFFLSHLLGHTWCMLLSS